MQPLLCCVAAMIAASAPASPLSTAAAMVLPPSSLRTRIYSGTADMRRNPERGFRHELHPDGNGTLTPASLLQLAEYNLSVAQTYWYLPSDPVLSEATLKGVSKTLRTLRSVGVKALFRFAYDHCDAPGGIGENNYTAATILSHIQQLKARFQAEIDAVYVLQAGFVGCWGEWHGARHMSDPFVFPLRGEVQQVVQAELTELLPPDRKMNLRYPALKFDVVLHRDCPQMIPQCGGYPGTGAGGGVPTGVLPPPVRPKRCASSSRNEPRCPPQLTHEVVVAAQRIGVRGSHCR
jgi:hypothetical protein